MEGIPGPYREDQQMRLVTETRTGIRNAPRVLVPALVAVALAACGGDASQPVTDSTQAVADSQVRSPSTQQVRLADTLSEQALLDAAFRIDIELIQVWFDVTPGEQSIRAQATLTFRMRPGQTRPVIHLTPAVRGSAVTLRLGAETLDVAQEADVRFVSFEGSSQVAMELQRDLEPDTPHIMELVYDIARTDGYDRFYTEVNDIQGLGNEALFPTINVPHELARHVITFRVHSPEEYRCIGSGSVVRAASSDVQEWVLDTEREIASYTVMFFLAPAADTVLEERSVSGVDVRVMTHTGGSAEGAFSVLGAWLPALQNDFGPFPMPNGLSVFVTQSGGGMEYYGGTITSLAALGHEAVHMYFGCSTVAKTYRDSWWDEAADVWYQDSLDPAFPAIADVYTSNLVGGRSPIGIGFDTRAYDEGAQIFEAVARELGGREAAIVFWRQLHLDHSFAPFTTLELVELLREHSGVDMSEEFLRWLYTDGVATAAVSGSRHGWLHQVDMTPPEHIRRKH